MAVNKRKNIKYIFLAVFILAVLYVTFNEEGLLKMLKNDNELTNLQDSLKQVQMENAKLQSELDSLKKKVPAKIERVAREKYNMKRPNEQTIKVIEE